MFHMIFLNGSVKENKDPNVVNDLVI